MNKKNEFRRFCYINAIPLSLIPCLVFAAFNLSPVMALYPCVSALCSALCELFFSRLRKRKFDMTVITLSLVSAMAIPGDASVIIFILCGILLYALTEAFKCIRRYVGISLPALAFSIVTLFFTSFTSADSIVSGHMPEGIFVKDLLIGNYTMGMTICSSIVCLLFALVVLSFSGKINFIDMLISIISFGYFVSVLCEGNGITSLTMISFILLDGKVFFALSLIAILKGYSIPSSSPVISKLFIIAQSALGAYLVCRGTTYGVYYSICIFSLISLTIEKTAYRKNIKALMI